MDKIQDKAQNCNWKTEIKLHFGPIIRQTDLPNLSCLLHFPGVETSMGTHFLLHESISFLIFISECGQLNGQKNAAST